MNTKITGYNPTKILKTSFNGYDENGGKFISLTEYNHFAKVTLYENYLASGISLSPLNIDDDSKFDFIADLGLDKRVGFIVKTKVLGSNKEKREEFNEIVIESEENNIIPRLVTFSFWVFETRGDWFPLKLGENNFRNGLFPNVIHIDYFTLLNQPETKLPEILSHNELVDLFANSWSQMDSKIIEPFLHNNFNYSSDWVFDVLPSKTEYLEYYEGKLKTLIEHRLKPQFEIVTNDKNESALLFNQNGELALFVLTTNNGWITSARMMKYETKLENIESENKKRKWWKKIFGN